MAAITDIPLPRRLGGSVIAALKADGSFVPRAVTRNRASEAAQKLTSQGVEVVQADLWDKASLSKALVGSEGVFGVCVQVTAFAREHSNSDDEQSRTNFYVSDHRSIPVSPLLTFAEGPEYHR